MVGVPGVAVFLEKNLHLLQVTNRIDCYCFVLCEATNQIMLFLVNRGFGLQIFGEIYWELKTSLAIQ